MNVGLIVAGFLAVETGATDQVEQPRLPSYNIGLSEMPSSIDIADASDPILLRPVFFASRRPFVPPPPKPVQVPVIVQQPPDPALSLNGIVRHKALMLAHLATAAEPNGVWLKVGQSIDGRTIVSISETAVTLRQFNKDIRLFLYNTASSSLKSRTSLSFGAAAASTY